jgi:peptidoglycan-N-acetylglucosamine deacetylase
MYFTTSWDDGHPLDIKLVDLLKKHNIRGTLYIQKSHPFVPSPLTTEDIRELGEYMEIGAHTITHPTLTEITNEEVQSEVIQSKQWIENITNKECSMFCYPKGKHNEDIMKTVQSAGFMGARTTEAFCFDHSNRFALPTSLHAYPFPFRPIANRRFLQPILDARPHLSNLGIPITKCLSWTSLAKRLFRHAYDSNQKWFHLWGHSWEVEKYKMWDALDSFFEYASSHKDIEFVSNSEIL